MPDKEELEERITQLIDNENTLDAKTAPCYNEIEKEERHAERL